jgi:hypothetical protein
MVKLGSTTAEDPSRATTVAVSETLAQDRAIVNLFCAEIAGDSPLRRFIFYGYVALSGVEAAYREATAARDEGLDPSCVAPPSEPTNDDGGSFRRYCSR